MSSYDETQSFPPSHSTTEGPAPTDPTEAPTTAPDTETDDDDRDRRRRDRDDDDDPAGSHDGGTEHDGQLIGPNGIFELAHCADRLGLLATATRGRFGERILALADRVRDLANEARQRLAAQPLPDDAGTPDQHERIEAEIRRRAAAADQIDGEPALPS